jgi:hypothetical protein
LATGREFSIFAPGFASGDRGAGFVLGDWQLFENESVARKAVHPRDSSYEYQNMGVVAKAVRMNVKTKG